MNALQAPSSTSGKSEVRFASKRDAAAYVGVSPRTINSFLRAGCPHVKMSPKIVRIDLNEMATWLKEHYGVRRR
jgi:hypothetical protein